MDVCGHADRSDLSFLQRHRIDAKEDLSNAEALRLSYRAAQERRQQQYDTIEEVAHVLAREHSRYAVASR